MKEEMSVLGCVSVSDRVNYAARARAHEVYGSRLGYYWTRTLRLGCVLLRLTHSIIEFSLGCTNSTFAEVLTHNCARYNLKGVRLGAAL